MMTFVRLSLTVFLFFVFLQSVFSQGTTPISCIQEQLHEQLINQDTAFKNRHNAMEKMLLNIWKRPRLKSADTLITIPIVFHIIHQNGPENISEERINLELQNLNDAFANLGAYQSAEGADIGIQFCLAQRTPDNSFSNGIERVSSPLTDFNFNADDFAVKNLSRYDPEKYINVWIVNEICSGDNCAVAGYAYLPASHGNNRDGIVIEARSVGVSSANSSVLIHEMGHYFGLYHTFYGGCENDNCLIDGDRVCDTPPDNTVVATPCDVIQNSCSTDTSDLSENNPFRPIRLGGLGDQPDPQQNYMDYAGRNCRTSFTEGQKERMRRILLMVRKSLLTSDGCLEYCPDIIAARFEVNGTAGSNSIFEVNEEITFTNLSNNSNNFEWRINGRVVSNQIDFRSSFSTPGTYVVELIASHLQRQNCIPNTARREIQVVCSARALIEATDSLFLLNNPLTFNSVGVNIDQISWELNGVMESTESSFSFTPNTTGIYELCLTVKNEACEETTCLEIDVIDPSDLCGGTFVYRFGGDDFLKGEPEGEYYTMCQTSDGKFILGGSVNKSNNLSGFTERFPALTRIDPRTGRRSEIISFLTVGSTNNGILHLREDKEGMLFGLTTSNEIFRYDLKNEQILWFKDFDPAYNLSQIIEDPSSGDYFICGYRGNNFFDQYATLIRIDAQTGEVTWFFSDFFNSDNRFDDIAIADGKVYCSGYVSNSTFRPSSVMISIFDLSGRLLEIKVYTQPLIRISSTFSTRILATKEGILIGFNGSKINSGSRVGGLLKINNQGELQWIKRYSLGQFSVSNFVLKIKKVVDGYLILGNGTDETISQNVILTKINNEGQVIFTRVYGERGSTSFVSNVFSNEFILADNGIYITLTSRQDIDNTFSGSSFRPINHFLKVNPDGTYTQRSCRFFIRIVPSSEDVTFFQESSVNLRPASLILRTNDIRLGFEKYEDRATTTAVCEAEKCCVNDLVVAADSAICQGDSLSVKFTIQNKGVTPFDQSLNISFYDENPTESPNSEILKTIKYENLKISIDSSLTFSLIVPFPEGQLFIFLNDDGTNSIPFAPDETRSFFVIGECDYQNNLDSFIYNKPLLPLDLGQDTVICENGAAELDAGEGFYSYLWSDASDEQYYTAFEPGVHTVEATTICGETLRDTVLITIDTAIQLQIDPAISYICPEDTATLTIPDIEGYTYQWIRARENICEDCKSLTVSPSNSTVYNIVATNPNGCISADSLLVNLISCDNKVEIGVCPNDSVLYRGKIFFPNDLDTIRVNLDTVLLVKANPLAFNFEEISLFVCPDKTLSYEGIELGAGDTQLFEYTGANGCDSTLTLNVLEISIIETEEEQLLCSGDSLIIFDQLITQPGVYQQTFLSTRGCDSIHTIRVTEVTPPILNVPTGNINCLNNTGILEVQIEGTASPFDILWSNGESNPTISNLTEKIYQVTVSDQNGCQATATGIVPDTIPNITAQVLSEDMSCFGITDGQISVRNVANGIPPFQYSLNGSSFSNSPAFEGLSDGIYDIIVKDINDCRSSFEVVISEPLPLVINLAQQLTIKLGDTIQINPDIQSALALQYNWFPIIDLSCVDCPNPLAYPMDNITYELQIIDENNCEVSASTQIIVDKRARIFIPNVFSPNGDGINDYLGIFGGNDVKSIQSFRIFSRWGSLVFERENIPLQQAAQLWNGKLNGELATNNLFIYAATVEFIDGSIEIFKGEVKILF